MVTVWNGFIRLKSSFLNIFLLGYQKIALLKISKKNTFDTLYQAQSAGIGSLAIVLLTACFIGMVFTLQVGKEFVSLNATSMLGAVLAMAFIRELSPVLTAVIVAGRIGSSFTAQLAAMKITEQIDVLYVLKTNPVSYLVAPRLYACLLILPILNTIALATSLCSCILTSFVLYNIPPALFLSSSYKSLSVVDFFYSSIKAMTFGLVIATVSCTWGLKATGGSKGVGKSTTSSVVTILICIFIIDFLLSFLMFNSSESIFRL